MTEKDTATETPSAVPSIIEPDDASEGTNSSMYKYRDFSKVSDDEIDQQPSTSDSPPPSSSRGGVESSIRVQKFPVKLYAILAQKEFHDIITWMPHGRSWKVLKPNLFESLVMPLFFEYSNYHSFNRLVNAWSFRRISSGPDRGSYYHEVRGRIPSVLRSLSRFHLTHVYSQLFLRGKPHLQKFMRRLPKTHKKLPMKKEDEPDFYAMDKANPLPSLEDAPLPSTAMMPQMRQQQAIGGPGAGMLPPQMMTPMGAGAGMAGMSAFGEARDPFIGVMSQARGAGQFGGNAMGMNAMGSIGGMGAMNGMGSMNGMPTMNGMGPMSPHAMGPMGGIAFGGMNAMNGMNSLRDSTGFGGTGMSPDLELQRLRQLQQMQLLEMGGATAGMGGMGGLANDPLAMNLRMGRQPC